MKIKLRLLGSMMLLFLVTYGAQAVVIFQDNFSEYASGPLGTNTPTWFSPPGDPTYATNTGISASGGSSVTIAVNAPASVQSWALFTNGPAGYTFSTPAPLNAGITNITGTNWYYFPSNGPVAALYASFTFTFNGTFTNNTSNYYAMFINTNFNLHPRMFVCTNTATFGSYRMGIDNNSSSTTGNAGSTILPVDLTYGTTYYVVFKQVLSTGLATLWVEPNGFATNEAVTSNSISPTAAQSAVLLGGGISYVDTTGTNIGSFTALCGFGFHSATLYGSPGSTVVIGPLTCGTTFADVVPSSDGYNAPFIAIQPASGSYITGAPATLSVVAGGDLDTITYQWYGPSGQIVGANSSTYTIPSVLSGASGYSVAITNAAGNVTSGTATITGINSSAVPTITTQPANASTSLGSAASFSVVASDGGAPLTYQWYGPAGLIANQTNATLSLSGCVVGMDGSYYVTVANYNGPTNSTSATLTVNPPAIATIAYIRSLLDNTNFNTNGTTALFTIQGTNNTWENQTTAPNSEFNLQDGTGGMNIFWSGADAVDHMPPAGAVLTITAPLAEFDGILEMEPVYGNLFHTVTTNSTNGILPVPMPLPFDPNMVGNPTNMQKHLMSCYFSASNVFLDLSTGPTFGDDDAEPLTNGQPYTYNLTFSYPNGTNQQTVVTTNFAVTNQIGQTNTMYYNDHVINFIGATKPIGPCTIYGILSIHVTATPYTSGYEFVATRLADVIPALVFTNVISNVIRYGDLATNTYTQNVLQPGETLTMNVIASDPGGGNVTLTGPTTGMGTWSAVNGSGTHTLTATYTYTGSNVNAGVLDTPTLPVSFSSSGFNSTYTWSIYVPTVPEQTMRITEVLPYASNNTNSPAYNPLGRPLPESDSVSYDQYVEIVNFGSSSVNINHWNVGNGSTSLHEFAGGESLDPGNAALVYGGLLNSDPDPPSVSAEYVEPASTGNGLTLTASAGVITLLDNHGNLVDRVAYPAAGYQVLDTNFNVSGQTQTNLAICSYSRFPNATNGPLVPQVFISTNYVTPGTQYDGSSWGSPTQVPTAVGPITTAAAGGIVNLSFTAGTVNTTTLWLGNSLLQPFSVLSGGTFTNTSGSFIISNTPPKYQYYFITTETTVAPRGPS